MKNSVLIGVIALILGYSIGQSMVKETVITKEVPKIVEKQLEKKVEVATSECKRAVEIDNAVFTYLGENLSTDSQDLYNIAEYLDSIRDERVENANICLLQ
mgnify:FL=1